MSTHPEFIKRLVDSLKPQRYLELGLYEGETFNKVSPVVPYCIGVDVTPKFVPSVGKVYAKTTDQFFLDNNDSFDFIFIDADHRFDQVKKDFDNSVKILNKYGVIILHDTDPIRKELLNPGYCGDSYRMVEYVESLGDYNMLTLQISDPGLSIVKRKRDLRVEGFI